MPRRSVAVLAAILGVGVAAPAQAAVTASEITSPADGARWVITDAQPATDVVVTGTSDGTVGDTVDIRCYWHADAWEHVPDPLVSVAVAADGSFSATLGTDDTYGTCILRAVPHDLPATSDASLFTGPRVTTEWNTSSRVASGPNAGKVFDFYVLFQGENAVNDYTSATGCGLCDSRLQYASGYSSEWVWFANAKLGLGVENRSAVQVDGRDAYGPRSAQRRFEDNPGLPELSFDAGRDAATGDTTIHESEPMVVCPNAVSSPPTSDTCPRFDDAGVRLERAYFADDGGRQVHVTDTWRSTDGAAHMLSLHYEQWLNGSLSPGLAFSWAGGFQTFTTDRLIAGPPPGPGSILVRASNAVPSGSERLPLGALSFDRAPSAVRWSREYQFTLHEESVLVPAGGTATIRQDFVLGLTPGEVAAKAAANEDRFSAPTVSISAPADGSTVTGAARTKQITVTGSASDHIAVASLTLDGAPVALGANGAFSVPATLALGENSFTAIARDAAGNRATATATVTYADNVSPVVTDFSATPRRFRVGARPTPVTALVKRGTTFTFGLSEDADVTIKIARLRPGKRNQQRCVKPTKKLRSHKSCLRRVPVGGLHRTLAAGPNSVKFTGRIENKKLARGRYLAKISAVDQADNASAQQTVKLRVVHR